MAVKCKIYAGEDMRKRAFMTYAKGSRKSLTPHDNFFSAFNEVMTHTGGRCSAIVS